LKKCGALKASSTWLLEGGLDHSERQGDLKKGKPGLRQAGLLIPGELKPTGIMRRFSTGTHQNKVEEFVVDKKSGNQGGECPFRAAGAPDT